MENARVNLWLTALVIAAAAAVSIAAMLAVRRYLAPSGSFFTDSDRAAGIFAVIGTAFAVLLAFVIFLAFESYSNARAAAGKEAIAVAQLFNTASLFPAAERRALQGDLICYSRAVMIDEWRTMRDGDPSPLVQTWVSGLESAADGLTVETAKQREAYGHWFDTYRDRLEGRRTRLAEAEPFVPGLLWLVLILGAVLMLAYMCFFADPAEPAYVQALLMGAVSAIAVSGLLTVRFLDRPYEDKSGNIKPTALEYSLALMEREWSTAAGDGVLPCGPGGKRA
jgi:hypothetical protein